MQELKRQIRRQKVKMFFLSLIIWGIGSIGFAWLIYSKEMERGTSSTQAMESIMPWGIGFAGVLLVWILAVFIVVDIKDDYNKELNSLTESEKAELEQEIRGIDLFRVKLTVGNSLVILNANGYTLKLIHIRNINRVYMKQVVKLKRRMTDSFVIHFHTKSGKEILSSAIAVTDPVYPMVEAIVDNLARRIKKR